MLTQKDILTFLTNIKHQLQKDGIEEVGLFGSYAKNNATLTSDIDIAIKLNKNYLDKNDVRIISMKSIKLKKWFTINFKSKAMFLIWIVHLL